ncbi:SDR family NAD(P)-dependent oxidoreductase [Hyalangium versicolor]|uniref:SDR family NAD(P)-dependent oxidoreductase n=1 Tax=Hyalangium versicolor TaxID=2861190 RepID=UPI001CCE3534|nr:SDR family oxidoreductase [Hyalangium versicolor]
MTAANSRTVVAPIALITGGSRGLGKSMALQLADRGVDVILTYRSAEKEARDVAAEIEAKGRKAAILALDVGRSAGFAAFAEAVKGVLARVWKRERFDYLVNNAGTGLLAGFAETTEEQFDEQLNVHLKGTFFLTQRLLPLIADGGRIVNMSTGLTRYTYPGSSAYAVMKGGVEVLTRYMARELGPRGISVNVIAPGGIETDFGGGVMRNPELQKVVAAQTALGRVGVPDDIGGVVAMLLSPESRWLTGQRLEVTGGYSL